MLDDGRKVTRRDGARADPGGAGQGQGRSAPNGTVRPRAREIFEQMSTQDEFAEFLTLPLYEEI